MAIEKLIFENDKNDFIAWMNIQDNKVKLTVCDFEEVQEEKATTLANKTFEWLLSNLEIAKQFAAKELVSLKNQAWLEENEAEITEALFISKIKLRSILVYSEGNFELYFDDDDIFWEHVIIVTVNEHLVIEEASIAG